MTDARDRRHDEFRPDIPSPARVYNYILGEKDHYPADRVVAENTMAAVPSVGTAVLDNRAFLGRVVRFLAAEAGIRQFLDIGTGLPSEGQVHEIAQRIAPESRVVYVDDDPVVLAHGRDMLHGVDNALIVRHDLRDPEAILGDTAVRRLLDFDRPIAVLLVAILHFIADADDPGSITERLMAPLPPGSHLVISHGTHDHNERLPGALAEHYRTSSSAHVRSREQIAALFDGLELVEPGLVWTPLWRPDPGSPVPDDPPRSLCYAGVARKR